MTRAATIKRNTAETQIQLKFTLDGTGQFSGSTGVGFFDHMLELFTRHGAFDLAIQAEGDLKVDQHHTVEDVGICLGMAIRQALGDK
ncbi:MAG: imidazoleglycerol-phosphate dehydratase, partial [Pirellulaceae bacterium]